MSVIVLVFMIKYTLQEKFSSMRNIVIRMQSSIVVFLNHLAKYTQ